MAETTDDKLLTPRKLSGNKPLVSLGIPLLRLTEEADMNLAPLKLLNMYLAAINPNNIQTAPVRITVREYAKTIGVPYHNISLSTLEEHLRVLTSLQIVIKQEDGKKKLGAGRVALINAFSYAMVEPELHNGKMEQTIKIQCNPQASHLFFNLAEVRYLKYRLQYVARLKKLPAYKLYIFLLENRRRLDAPFQIDAVRRAFRMEQKYTDTRNFMRTITGAAAELTEKTDLVCEVERVGDPDRDGRRKDMLLFRVKDKAAEKRLEAQPQKSEPDTAGAQLTLEGLLDLEDETRADEIAKELDENWMFRSAFRNSRYPLSREAQDLVIQTAKVRLNSAGNDLFDYLCLVVAEANANPNVKNPCRYMCGIINSGGNKL